MSGKLPYDYHEVEFGPDGAILQRAQVDELIAALRQPQAPTDLIFISHGWNTTHDGARDLYQDFFNHFKARADAGQPADVSNRKFAILGVLWPSVAITDPNQQANGAAQPGTPAAAGLTPVSPAGADLSARLQTFAATLDRPDAAPLIAEIQSLLPQIENFPSRQRRVVQIVRSLLPQDGESLTLEDASPAFFRLDPLELINRLAQPTFAPPPPSPSPGPSSGGAAGLGDVIGGIGGAFSHLLNYASYYVMKGRAGTVGRGGAYQVLRELRDDIPTLQLHLVGHSFGARLVTAATDGPDGKPPVFPQSLALLQAAFSHNGFAHFYDGVHDGFFRSIVTGRKVKGPVLITFSKQDTAVGIAYPIASRLSGDTASALGDKDDIFGGLGRNGAQKTPEADTVTLGPASTTYSFRRGRLLNLNGDAVITSHMDICRDEVASALVQAVAATG